VTVSNVRMILLFATAKVMHTTKKENAVNINNSMLCALFRYQ